MEPQVQPPPPCILTIFGFGDLTHRLLIPALCNLRRAKMLPEDFAWVVIDRSARQQADVCKDIAAAISEFTHDVSDSDADWVITHAHYFSGDFSAADTYTGLAAFLDDIDKKAKTGGNRLFYLAIPAQVFTTVANNLGHANLLDEKDGWRRVIIEKPFGQDLTSAQALNRDLLGVMQESQIYRIDHYLGKETVQNIWTLRFANGLFEPLWNRDHIDHVQITVAETVNVEHRGGFYDATGALRDMVPNHLMQLLTVTAMEPPARFDADALRTEKAKVLDAVHPFTPDIVKQDVVRAQYGAGTVNDKQVIAYREAEDVPRESATETYVALKLMIDNWRWAGVPFYLRTGKALGVRRSEIVIRFKCAPLALFKGTPVDELAANDLILRIQPNEGATLRINAKIPGPAIKVGGVEMKFNYQEYFKLPANTGYETLIYDAMIGDPTLFQRADNIEGGWRVVQPILDAWAADRSRALPTYSAGSAGPKEADALLARDGRAWMPLSGSRSPAP